SLQKKTPACVPTEPSGVTSAANAACPPELTTGAAGCRSTQAPLSDAPTRSASCSGAGTVGADFRGSASAPVTAVSSPARDANVARPSLDSVAVNVTSPTAFNARGRSSYANVARAPGARSPCRATRRNEYALASAPRASIGSDVSAAVTPAPSTTQ